MPLSILFFCSSSPPYCSSRLLIQMYKTLQFVSLLHRKESQNGNFGIPFMFFRINKVLIHLCKPSECSMCLTGQIKNLNVFCQASASYCELLQLSQGLDHLTPKNLVATIVCMLVFVQGDDLFFHHLFFCLLSILLMLPYF